MPCQTSVFLIRVLVQLCLNFRDGCIDQLVALCRCDLPCNHFLGHRYRHRARAITHLFHGAGFCRCNLIFGGFYAPLNRYLEVSLGLLGGFRSFILGMGNDAICLILNFFLLALKSGKKR